MKLVLLLTLLATTVVAQSRLSESQTGEIVTRPGVPQASAQAAQTPSVRVPMPLEGGVGFASLHYLLNRAAWSELPSSGITLKQGVSVVSLEDPLQAIVLFNGWHLPAAHGSDDIRLADLKNNVLRKALTFTPKWPEYTAPGYIVIVQKHDREWVLIANLAGHYIVEDKAGIGVSSGLSQ